MVKQAADLMDKSEREERAGSTIPSIPWPI
jgi:hypothetical protein